jgi:hypothetical protein
VSRRGSRQGLVRAAAVLAALAGGCGWHAGLQAPEAGGSVGVAFFDQVPGVLERGLEPRLQTELSRVVSEMVHAPLEAPDRADYVIEGEILEYRRRSGVRTDDNELVESGVRMIATARLVDRQTGALVGAPAHAEVWSGYALDAADAENAAQERVLRYLAESIVLDLFGPERAPEERADRTR